MTTDEYTMKLREDAIRSLVPYIETAKPYQANDDLANQFYEFVMNAAASKEVPDANDRIMVVDDVMSYFDHDLSDYLMLGQYRIDHQVVENGEDPSIDIQVYCDDIKLMDLRMSLSTAALMARKRQRELA